MALEEVGARLITEGEAQFLSAMMNAQKAVKGVGDTADKTHGPMSTLTAKTIALGQAMGMALYNAAISAGKALIGFAQDSITAASDLNETTSKVGVVFGDQADAVLAFGKTAATALGMSENAALTAAGTYGNLFRSMGMTETSSADMSTSLVTLAGDLASFNNMDPTEVMDKLRAGLTGESEPLKSLGININEAVIRQEALSMGLVKGKDALTASAKAQAVYSLMMKQTSLAQGDFARTSDGLANQQRIFAANLENTKAQLGKALLPAVNLATKAFNEWLTSPAFQKGMENFTAGLSGIISWITTNWPAISAIFQQVWTAIETGVSAVIAFVTPYIQMFSDLWTQNSADISATVSALWSFLSGIFNTIVSMIGSVIAIIAPMVQMFLASLAQWWSENGTAIIATVTTLWNSVSALFSAAAGLIVAIVGALVRLIMQFWQAHGTEIMTFLTGLWTFIAGLFTTVTGTIALIFEAFTALLNGDTEEFSAKMQEAWQFLWDAIRGAAEVAWAALSAWFQGIIQAIIGFFTHTNWSDIGSKIINGIWSGLQAGWTWLTDKVRDLALSLLQAAKDALGIESPSKAFQSIGKNMMLGMAKGIMDNAISPTIATTLASQMTMGAASAVSAGPSTYNYQTANNYNLSVMTSQSPQVVTRSFAMMKMLAG